MQSRNTNTRQRKEAIHTYINKEGQTSRHNTHNEITKEQLMKKYINTGLKKYINNERENETNNYINQRPTERTKRTNEINKDIHNEQIQSPYTHQETNKRNT